MSLHQEIQKQLFNEQDLAYRDFQSKLMPNIAKEAVIGVRTPALRAMAKDLFKREDIQEFLHSLPHRYFEENQLHAFILSSIKDFDESIAELDRFLPHVDNWATCDQMKPKPFAKNRKALLTHIDRWMFGSGSTTYSIRFGIEMLMNHFLDEDFKSEYLKKVAKVRSEEYYVNMMVAWYFATALAKQYNATIPFIEKRLLSSWCHNKSIQKSIESFRITEEQKAYLRTLKI